MPPGEGGFFQARRTMDTVIDDLARAVKKLSSVGVRNAVVSADHGHLFGHADREEAMRVDAPGGDTVDLHRRCWIGRGGKTPPGAIRVLGRDARLRLGPRRRLPAGDGRVQGGRRSRVPPRRPDAPGARRAGCDDPHRGAHGGCKGRARDRHGRALGDHQPDLQRHHPARRTEPLDVQRPHGRPAHADRRRPPGREGGDGGRSGA